MTQHSDDRTLEIVIPPEHDGMSIDLAVKPHVSRTKARKLISKGRLFLDGIRVHDARVTVTAGQTVRLVIPGDRKVPRDVDWRQSILYKTRYVVVVNKPPGVPASPSPKARRQDLRYRLARYLKQKRLWLVHRIDQETSGIMLIARNALFARLLSRAFVQRRVDKLYLAAVLGRPERMFIDMPIRRAGGGQRKVRIDGDECRTEILHSIPFDGGRRSLVLIRLHTGRTHQIRVHLSHLGFPILGDGRYGLGEPPMFLHAWRFSIFDWAVGARTWTAPVPEHWRKLMPLVERMEEFADLLPPRIPVWPVPAEPPAHLLLPPPLES